MPSPLTLVEPVPTGDTAAPPRPTLTSPAEATDLDPAAGSVRVELVAAPHVWNGVDGYAYNDQVPGPTLRAVVGDTLTIELDNRLEMPTTIHWHGLEVPYAMDGAGWQVAPVAAGDTFTYTFTVQKAGTFWYHPHFNTERQVDLGLYGVLIVEDPEEPVLEELVVVFDGPSEVVASQIDPTVDPSPTTWLLNGLEDPVWSPPAGETVRVRMVNASNAGYVALDDVRVIARDQGLLEAPESEFVLAPGDRAELEWSVGPEPSTLEPVPWSSAGPAAQPPLRLMDVEPVGDDPRPEHIDWGFVGTLPTEDPGRTDLRYTFTGSAAAGWEINGQTFPAIEPDRFAWGTTVVLEIRNPSPAHHPFHLHGLTFEVLSVDGVVPAVRRVEDTLDVGVRQTVRLLVDANNPGEWMSHCHILPHAENGMMTVFAVE
jgi:FtsP/CotA-like multicopper oxidase with cupredoxin domain